MRFHILGIPHTSSTDRYLSCAYTQKVVKLCDMLHSRGHFVVHYGCEDSNVHCNEHVAVTSLRDLAMYDPQAGMGQHFQFDVNDRAYKTFYANANYELQQRKQPRDFLLCMWGHGHRVVADTHNDMIVVEPGIGYPSGHFAPWKVFESYAVLHAFYGLEAVGIAGRIGWYDVVIPNYFYVKDFVFNDRKQDYVLFLGRLSGVKGLSIAIDAAKAAGVRLVLAGTGQPDISIPNDVEVVGFCDKTRRAELMANARALFCATTYVEPFGGVHIEAMLCGTPVISTDWGVFPETNLHGVTGYRCRTLEQFVWAIKNIDKIDPYNCFRWARDNFSIERVGAMHDEYFAQVMGVYTGAGWPALNPDRHELDWLTRYYP